MIRSKDDFFHPVSGMESPRFAGVPTFMRLPNMAFDHPRINEVELGLVGVPWDAGTTNRPGPRHGPRQLRDYSTMIRRVNPATGGALAESIPNKDMRSSSNNLNSAPLCLP